ncbi:hypothetical protein AVEN_125673-1 [Araneus ventricosus]|uniref:Uncharacterized protein n=1 Tax=Araneus ventricosus TaxID=182803 RepID=A0A4Y2IFM2_ARAVE|nr:hypothetical protein AVEN_125673-1 [Araneus ventricosus]
MRAGRVFCNPVIMYPGGKVKISRLVGLTPDFTKDPSCMWAWQKFKSEFDDQHSGSLDMDFELSCHPRHQTTVRNNHPKVTFNIGC